MLGITALGHSTSISLGNLNTITITWAAAATFAVPIYTPVYYKTGCCGPWSGQIKVEEEEEELDEDEDEG
jgi:hypothetical protein